jgi:hypothetical protein
MQTIKQGETGTLNYCMSAQGFCMPGMPAVAAEDRQHQCTQQHQQQQQLIN